MKDLNLVPESIYEQQRASEKNKILIISGIIVVVFSLTVVLFPLWEVNKLKEEKVSVENEIKGIESFKSKDEQNNIIAKEISKKNNILSEIKKQEVIQINILSNLEQSMPAKVVLSNLNITAGDNYSINLACNGADEFAVADFLSNLRRIKNFHAINTSAITDAGGNKMFSISLLYVPKE